MVVYCIWVIGLFRNCPFTVVWRGYEQSPRWPHLELTWGERVKPTVVTHHAFQGSLRLQADTTCSRKDTSKGLNGNKRYFPHGTLVVPVQPNVSTSSQQRHTFFFSQLGAGYSSWCCCIRGRIRKLNMNCERTTGHPIVETTTTPHLGIQIYYLYL